MCKWNYIEDDLPEHPGHYLCVYKGPIYLYELTWFDGYNFKINKDDFKLLAWLDVPKFIEKED